ncbi:AAA family ATPase [Vibrio vulnificus]|uniref:AAA family ATPase n=1 Tax=Vibrio vulnificus TaxID=672 RepID=UPI001A3306FC|nr:AAA family ATPase [Vibrio vulnificus]MCG8703419.1 ATP-binding protein [Vibrio vulnificus]HAS8153164.1 hypothetical protein [Vibrio vulnificus]
MYEITTFRVCGLFGQYDHSIDFRKNDVDSRSKARLCVIVGKNGVGKTTALNMIEGILKLDFSIFREVPFSSAELTLSSEDRLTVTSNLSSSTLEVSFNDLFCSLSLKESGPANELCESGVEKLRQAALPKFTQVSFETLDIHRSSALRDRTNLKADEDIDYLRTKSGKLIRGNKRNSKLTQKVHRFVREAQVDYRKYFTSEGPELFPKIIKRLQGGEINDVTIEQLIDRLNVIKDSEPSMSRFGLSLNMSDIEQLTSLLSDKDSTKQSTAAISALEAYVETLESKHAERLLISDRLIKFEKLVGEFLTDKVVAVDYQKGLTIYSAMGDEIDELMLSSGEYHLLYMLVTALVSTRNGTAIAIDEPELSLHVSWQRKLVSALIECSSGASPLFILATHSASIASEHQDQWVQLG